MALTGSTISSTYLKLLRANSDTMGADATASYIQDSADTDSVLSISTTRVGIGNAAPDSLLEIQQGSSGGLVALKVDNDDTDKVAVSIEAANIDADVMDISADAVTTANVIDITADGLTSGKVLNITSTGTLTGSIIDITADSATTGNGINMSMDALTTGSAAIFATTSTALATTVSGGLVEISSTGNSTTNVNNLLYVHNDHASATGTIPLMINQDANQKAIYIDHDGVTSEATMYFASPTTTTGTVIRVDDCDALTTGRMMELKSASTDTGTRSLVQITNDAAAATGATCLSIQQDSTGPAIDVGGGYIANEQGRQDHVANTMPAPYYRFDGVNDEIKADNIITDFPFSVSCNVRTAPLFTGTHQMFSFADANVDENYIGLNADATGDLNIIRRTSATESSTDTGFDLSVNTNYHIVGVWDSATTATVYVNGVSVYDATGLTSVLMSSSFDIFITGFLREPSGGGNWNGEISSVTVYNLALTATEVKELYSGASVPWKHKGANETTLWDAAAGLFTSGTYSWAVFGNNTIANASNTLAITYVDNAAGAYVYFRDVHNLTSDLTVGKRYRFSCDASYTGGSAGVKLRVNNTTGGGGYGTEVGTTVLDSSALTGSTVRYHQEFTAASTQSAYINLTGMGASNVVTLDNLSLIPIGAVAEYDGTGVGKLRWDDKSGNDLHGTLNGPTVENAPADADGGLTYEEGTWTPSVGGNASYTNQTGTYTKVGRMVNVSLELHINVIGTGSTSTISGLPFAALAAPNYSSTGAIGYASNLAVNIISLVFRVDQSGSTIVNINLTSAAATTPSGSAIFGNNARVLFSITYPAA